MFIKGPLNVNQKQTDMTLFALGVQCLDVKVRLTCKHEALIILLNGEREVERGGGRRVVLSNLQVIV